MKKTLLYRLFGIGKIPAQYSSALAAEGVILSDEGIKGTVTYLNFRAPHRYSNWKRQWYTAAIALTDARLLGFQYSSPIIDVPLTDARFRQLNFSVENDSTLLVAFDASLFHDDWSGNIEYRFQTQLAQEFLDKLTQKQQI
ncbi:MAG TPA: hypothetical protein VNB22_18180 [Pyrinomonadaceae bacterium]|nr:hypothetical protein [Pyrinomonadaceae bacterium]